MGEIADEMQDLEWQRSFNTSTHPKCGGQDCDICDQEYFDHLDDIQEKTDDR